MAANSSRRVAVWLGAILLFCFAYFAPHLDPNQTARLDLTVALVNHGTLAIDRYHQNTIDDDFYHGHYYIIKAPGQGLVGVPVYAAYRGGAAILGHRVPDDPSELWTRYIETFCTVAVPAILFLLLFFWFLGYVSSCVFNRALLTLALGLATIYFSYGTNFYAHVEVATLLFTAFILLFILERNHSALRPGTGWLVHHPQRTTFLVGLAVGLAFLLEFPTALISLLLGIYAAIRLPRRLWPYGILGVLPGVLVIMGYDGLVYHNPLVVPYTSGSSVSFKQALDQGIGGFTWPPRLEALWGMSFSPYRGLFFLSPFLLLAFPGYFLQARRGGTNWLLFFVIPVLYFGVIAMYVVWWGGLAAGPRHLIPTLPFLAFPIIFVLDALSSRVARHRTLVLVLYGLVLLQIAVSAVNVWGLSLPGFPDEATPDPLFTTQLPNTMQGNIDLNLGKLAFGLTGLSSLLPLVGLMGSSTLILFASPAWARLSRAPIAGYHPRALLRLISAPRGATALLLGRSGFDWRNILGLVLLARLVLGLIGLLALRLEPVTVVAGSWLNLLITWPDPVSQSFSLWQRWDALWYQQIAQHGYAPGNSTAAYFPLYPLLTRIVAVAFGGHIVLAEILVSTAALGTALWLLYRVTRLDTGPLASRLTLVLVLAFPVGFFLLAPYSEGLFLALTVASFWFARRGQPWVAGLAGMAAALTGFRGALLVLPLAYEYFRHHAGDHRRPGIDLLASVLPVIGLIVWLTYLRVAVGVSVSPLSAQSAWGLGVAPPWQVLTASWTHITRSGDLIEAINLACLLGFTMLAIWAARRLPLTYTLYLWPYLGFLFIREMAFSPLMSVSRFTLVLFPCFIVLSCWLARRPWLAASLLAISFALQIHLFLLWIHFGFIA